jgi:flagellar biosynthesis/type III secretory pathway M-ring protein FliF/YscJ
MDRLRQTLESIGRGVGSLTTIGKVAIGLGAVVVVLTLILVATLTGKATYVDLMPGAPAAKQREAAVMAELQGIKTGSRNGNVTVPSERRELLLGLLGEAGKLPDDSTVLFASLKPNMLETREVSRQNFNLALQNELARVIASFPSISKATVFIDAPEQVGLGNAHRRPSGTVTVFTRAGKPLTQQTVEAIASLVAGAKSGLATSDIRVIDGTSQRQFKTRGDSDMATGDYLEYVEKIEERVQGKLLEMLQYIPKVIVAVNAQADVRKTKVNEKRMLNEKEGTVSVVSKEKTEETSTTSTSGPAEAGVRSNVQDDVSRGNAGTGSRQSDNKGETEFSVAFGERNEVTMDAGGRPTKVNVTVNVPREYITQLVRVEKNDPKAEVTQADLDQKFTAEKDRITKDLQPLVETVVAGVSGPTTPTQAGTVVVSMIPVPIAGPEMMLGSPAASLAGGGMMGSMSELVGGGLVKNAILGLLALCALGMMFMLVRKAGKPVDLPSAEEIVGLPPALDSGADIVGEADEGSTAMEGIELPDDQVRVNKMLETIGEMVKNKPQDAASVLNRWIQVET